MRKDIANQQMANILRWHCNGFLADWIEGGAVRRFRMSAMEVTETPTAESEQMKEQVEEMHQQKVEEAKKEETPTQEEATKAVDSTLSHPSATSENTESSGEPEKRCASELVAGESGSGDTATAASTTIPTRQYLDQTVVPILLQALGALAKERPPNPIEYLANYLLKEKILEGTLKALVRKVYSKTMNSVMVKLFVGGLPDGVDSMRLRQLFSQFVVVNECDVIKDYAFVVRCLENLHVPEESDARTAIEKLDGYILEGKAINIRRSTSKLRKEPGMDKRCYRCGAVDHKTPQCPSDPANINLKRVASASCIGGPEQKRFIGDVVIAGESPSYAPGHDANAPGAFAYAAGSGAPGTRIDPDPELPRPLDCDLFPLYEQYMESRTKYFYFRDRLTKEVKARAHALPSISVAPLQAPYATNNVYSTPRQLNSSLGSASAAIVTYPSTTGASHFYANAVNTSATGAAYPTVQPLSQPTRLF
ncbi:RNA-binding protein rnp-1 [Dirofilaria immitis]|nr:RNA-binding protein rnp-1 [Dirofilaria immitis]